MNGTAHDLRKPEGSGTGWGVTQERDYAKKKETNQGDEPLCRVADVAMACVVAENEAAGAVVRLSLGVRDRAERNRCTPH